MKENPIGIFDSGVGGLTVWHDIYRLLPHESYIYFADSENAPYGQRSPEEIISLSEQIVEFLISKGCKLIVVACNTATTNAIAELRRKYEIPFIGIEPAIKPAALGTTTGSVGVLATKGTLASSLFQKTTNDYAREVTIIEREGKGLVPLIEKGSINTKETKELLLSFIAPMLEAGMDSLVLGCTHYPFLKPILKEILPPSIKIIDCGEAVARQTRVVLENNNLLNTSPKSVTREFFTNTTEEHLEFFLKGFYHIKDATIQIHKK